MRVSAGGGCTDLAPLRSAPVSEGAHIAVRPRRCVSDATAWVCEEIAAYCII